MPGNLYRDKQGADPDASCNELVIRIQPKEAIYLKINNKVRRPLLHHRHAPASCPCLLPPKNKSKQSKHTHTRARERAHTLSLCCQVPGLGLRLDTTRLDLQYQNTYQQQLPDAYERLLLDVVNGDKRLFIR